MRASRCASRSSADDHRSRMVNRRLISASKRRPKWRSINHFGLPRNETGSKGWSARMADERKRTPGFRRNHDRRRRKARPAAPRGDIAGDVVDAEYEHAASEQTAQRTVHAARPRVDRIGSAAGCRHGHAAPAGNGSRAARPGARRAAVLDRSASGLPPPPSGCPAAMRWSAARRFIGADAPAAARCASPASPRASTHRARGRSCSSTARRPMTARPVAHLPPLDIAVTGNDGAHHPLQAGDIRPSDGARRNIRLFEPPRCA